MSREQLIAQLRLSIVDCLQERVEGADLQNPVIVRNQNGYISHVEDGPVPSDIADASSSHVDDDFLSARFDFSDPITFKVSCSETSVKLTTDDGTDFPSVPEDHGHSIV